MSGRAVQKQYSRSRCPSAGRTGSNRRHTHGRGCGSALQRLARAYALHPSVPAVQCFLPDYRQERADPSHVAPDPQHTCQHDARWVRQAQRGMGRRGTGAPPGTRGSAGPCATARGHASHPLRGMDSTLTAEAANWAEKWRGAGVSQYGAVPRHKFTVPSSGSCQAAAYDQRTEHTCTRRCALPRKAGMSVQLGESSPGQRACLARAPSCTHAAGAALRHMHAEWQAGSPRCGPGVRGVGVCRGLCLNG